MIDMKIKQEENVVENSEEKKELSTEYLSRNPRVSKMEVSDQIFFAYEQHLQLEPYHEYVPRIEYICLSNQICNIVFLNPLYHQYTS